ncbi:Inositol-phosphate phosphatase [Leptothrix cholodnii SP-6]|uniref:inositol-phosphate phosphatase n=1 Tax=Leptothrix cholodnii (strain ATCC 51168 / LMG 8142 / SP-6) TaxID=395495 RepID=B1Y599_LEPCP|nr:Inositol-phosphate phosphatase [Leptothrix cholodnii SP-6]
MSQTNLHPMLNIAVKAARAGGAIISRASQDLDRLTVTSKGHNDFVTEVDQAAEHAIIDTILQAYPGHAILAEESGREHGAKHSDYVWIIDPLDGTTNFIHGFPQYAVSIALAYKGKVEQAVVYDPNRNDLFYATKGKGAFLNDKRLRVSKRTRLLECLIGTGFPFRKGDNFKRYMKMFEEVMQACAGVRRPGSAALDLCYVAAGWYDGFFETGLNPWDIAAGSLIITEAGGLVGNFTGEADYLYQRELVTGSPRIYAQLVQILAPYTRVIKEDEAEADTGAAAGAAAPGKTARAPKASKAPVSAATSASFAGTISATSSLSPTSRAAASAAETAEAQDSDEADEIDAVDAGDDGAEEIWAEPKRASTASERPMTPAQALAAAFDPTPVDTVAPTVTVRKPTRIRKADLPAPAEEERRPSPRGPKRHDDAPF